MTDHPAIRINEHAVRRVRMGYPWIFRSEVINIKESEAVEPGAVVDFTRDRGDFVARGYFNPRPQLCGRVLTHKAEEKIERFFVYHHVEHAIVYRDKIFGQPYYRLIHGEADGLPGLVVDRYGDVVVCQLNTAGIEKLYPHIELALKSLLQPKAIVLRNDTATRETEGLEQGVRVAFGELPEPVIEIHDGAAKFYVDVMKGQKTGWFFDQRDNRRWVAQLARDSTLLDVFCHTGGFGIMAALAGSQNVTFVDSSSDALMMVDRNAMLNGVAAKCQVIEGQAFEMLEKLYRMGRRFEVVSLDPPAFIKSKKDLGAGMKGYQKLAKLAAPLVVSAGYLFFASCSSHAETRHLIEVVSDGLTKAGRQFQLIKVTGAAPDHPVHPMLPETSYLKGLTFRFLD